MDKEFIHKLRCFRHYFWNLHQILYINFHFLPFNQAIKLPIWVKFYSNKRLFKSKGKIIIESEKISFGMIEMGVMQYFELREGMHFGSSGTLIFEGSAHISNASNIQICKNSTLRIGDGVGLSQTKIICAKSITIGKGTFVGVGSQMMDSDFHPIIDILGKSYINPTQSIKIGDYNWLGAEVMVLKGTKTPAHCIISARSILNKKYKIPECSIINNSCGQEIIMNGYIRDRFVESIEGRKSRSIENFDEYYQKLLNE